MDKFNLSQEAQARRLARDNYQHIRDGATISHANGNCAMEYGLCCACYEDLHRELAAWCARQPDPEPGEDTVTYWRRIDGPFYDAWHDVSSARVRATA